MMLLSGISAKGRRSSMNVPKAKVKDMLQDLPESVDIEELMYRLYLLQKIEAGEAAVENGHVLTHRETMERLSKKWQH
jgi:predicted transcriptional regulator